MNEGRAEEHLYSTKRRRWGAYSCLSAATSARHAEEDVPRHGDDALIEVGKRPASSFSLDVRGCD